MEFFPAPVFEIYSRRIKPGQTEAFERLREGFFRWVSRFDGVLGSAEFRYYKKTVLKCGENIKKTLF